jgi:uncharacterized protein (DUF1697 family)
MTTYVGLLRAVNVAGRTIKMADLRELLDGMGLQEAQTLLQSGNVVFRSDIRTAAELERLIERELAQRLQLATDVFVRSGREWHEVVKANPFPSEAAQDPSHLLAIVLKETPARAHVQALQNAITGRELVQSKARCAYVVYPDGIGRSRLTSALIEKHLGTRGTGRNWNSVLKLRDLADSLR